jgi:hypothetical protein
LIPACDASGSPASDAANGKRRSYSATKVSANAVAAASGDGMPRAAPALGEAEARGPDTRLGDAATEVPTRPGGAATGSPNASPGDSATSSPSNKMSHVGLDVFKIARDVSAEWRAVLKHRFGLRDGRRLEGDGDFLVVAADHYEFHGVAVAEIALLVRDVGGEIDEVAGPYFGGEFEVFAPADFAAAFDYIDSYFVAAVVVAAGDGAGGYSDRPYPGFLAAGACEVDRSGAAFGSWVAH